MKKFNMIDENFICENCGKSVEKHPEWSARNHCPFCLASKHLDKDFPGDRLSECMGLMVPSGIDHKKNKWWMIQHTCKKCKKEMLNKVAPDDHYLDFIKNLNRY